MRALRDIYWIVLLLFVATNMLFMFRTEASYWAIGLPQTATTDARKLSVDDYDRLDDAGDIVRQIVITAAIMSLLTAGASMIVLRSGIIRPRWLPILVLATSAAWGAYLLTQGSRFALRTPLVSEQELGTIGIDGGIASAYGSPGTGAERGSRDVALSNQARPITVHGEWRSGVIHVSLSHPFNAAWKRGGRGITSPQLDLAGNYVAADEAAITGVKILAEPLPWTLVENQFDDADEATLSVIQ